MKSFSMQEILLCNFHVILNKFHGIFNIQLLFCAADSGLGLFFVNVFQSREISLFSCKKRHICIYVRLRDQKVNFTLQRHEVAWSKIEFCASKKFKAFLNRQLQKSKQTLSYWDIDNNPSPVSAAQNNSWILNMPWFSLFKGLIMKLIILPKDGADIFTQIF